VYRVASPDPLMRDDLKRRERKLLQEKETTGRTSHVGLAKLLQTRTRTAKEIIRIGKSQRKNGNDLSPSSSFRGKRGGRGR